MIRIIEDVKAFFRGERRVSKAKRGRVYARKNGDQSSAGRHETKGRPVGKLQMKVTRANGDVEYIEAPLKEAKHG